MRQIAKMVENTYVDNEVEELVATCPEECSQTPEFEELKETLPTHIELQNFKPKTVTLQKQNSEPLLEEEKWPHAEYE